MSLDKKMIGSYRVVGWLQGLSSMLLLIKYWPDGAGIGAKAWLGVAALVGAAASVSLIGHSRLRPFSSFALTTCLFVFGGTLLGVFNTKVLMLAIVPSVVVVAGTAILGDKADADV